MATLSYATEGQNIGDTSRSTLLSSKAVTTPIALAAYSLAATTGIRISEEPNQLTGAYFHPRNPTAWFPALHGNNSFHGHPWAYFTSQPSRAFEPTRHDLLGTFDR